MQERHLHSSADAPPAVVGAALLAVASLTVIANATIAPSLPGLKETFRDTPYVTTLVGLVMTLPSLGIVLTAAIGGWLCDRYGRRPVMLGALTLYAVAGASGAFASSLTAILIGRMALGVGIGGTMTSAMAMIADRYHGAARQRLLGTQAAVMSGAGMLFLLIGGALGELGWRYPFLVYLSALAMIPVALVWLREPQRVADATNADVEQLPVGILALVGSTAMLSMIVFYLIPTKLPFLLKDVGITSPLLSGIAVAVSNLTMASLALSYPRMQARLRPFPTYALIFGLTALGFVIIATSRSYAAVLIGSAIAGAGYGWLFPINNALVMERTPASMRGRASGILTTSIFLGQFLSPLVSGPLVDRWDVATTFASFSVACLLITLAYALAEGARRRGILS